MSVGQACNREVVTIDAAGSVHEAARLMREHHVGDLFFSSVLVTSSVDDELEATLARMREHAIRRLPVVERDGSLAGIITMDDMLQQIAEQLARAVDLVTCQPGVEAHRRV